MTCQYCNRERKTIPVRITDLTTLNGHAITGERGGSTRSYTMNLCGDCIASLSGVPGGENVRVEPVEPEILSGVQ
jgi:hypothetical protein